MDARATTLDIAEFMACVRKDMPQPEQFNYDVSRDSIRHYTQSIGDGNALCLDPEYAASSRWRGLIAPPGYLYSHGTPSWLGLTPGIRNAKGEDLNHADNASETWEFFRPVRPGDTIQSYGYIEDAEIKHSRKMGEVVLVTQAMRFVNQRSDVVAKLKTYCFRFIPSDVSGTGKLARVYPDMPEGQFTRNVPSPPLTHGHRIVAPLRYDPVRYFEDVVVGEELPPWTVGPITAMNMGRFNAAINGSGYDRIGRYLHIPDGYAFGELRTAWLLSMLAQWGGPNGWVTQLSNRNQEWILVGFKVSCGGRVTGKTIEDGRCLVQLDVWIESELGFRTNAGTAEIELESRVHPFRTR